jgi:hypothetical protein
MVMRTVFAPMYTEGDIITESEHTSGQQRRRADALRLGGFLLRCSPSLYPGIQLLLYSVRDYR